MLDAPRQDWNAYQQIADDYDRQLARDLTPVERFARYEELFELVCQRPRPVEHRNRLEERRWQKKRSLRIKQLSAFGLTNPPECE